MTADETLDAIDQYAIRLVRRVGDHGWEYVAYNELATGIGKTSREAVADFLSRVKPA